MNSGYEVCIFKDNRWEVHSFFDEDQPDDATYQAQDIANNYQAVCVLHPAKMQVVFYKNKNPRTNRMQVEPFKPVREQVIHTAR